MQEIKDLNLLQSYEDQLYGAVCFSVINALEKILRMSLVRLEVHGRLPVHVHAPMRLCWSTPELLPSTCTLMTCCRLIPGCTRKTMASRCCTCAAMLPAFPATWWVAVL